MMVKLETIHGGTVFVNPDRVLFVQQSPVRALVCEVVFGDTRLSIAGSAAKTSSALAGEATNA